MSIESFFLGFVILVIGIVFMKYHQVIADNMGSGLGSYDRYKLVALGVCVVGILVMFGLHLLIFKGIGSFFPHL